jgi:hypothetical protein
MADAKIIATGYFGEGGCLVDLDSDGKQELVCKGGRRPRTAHLAPPAELRA